MRKRTKFAIELLCLLFAFAPLFSDPPVEPGSETANDYFTQPEDATKYIVKASEAQKADLGRLVTGIVWSGSSSDPANRIFDSEVDLPYAEAGIKEHPFILTEDTELHKALKMLLEPLGYAFYIDTAVTGRPVYHVTSKKDLEEKKNITVKYPFIENIYAEVKKQLSKEEKINTDGYRIEVRGDPSTHLKIRQVYKDLRERTAKTENGGTEMVRKVYPLTECTAGQIVRQVKGVLTRQGKIETDVKANCLIITDTEEAHKGVKELLHELDSPSR